MLLKDLIIFFALCSLPAAFFAGWWLGKQPNRSASLKLRAANQLLDNLIASAAVEAELRNTYASTVLHKITMHRIEEGQQ